MRVKCEPCQWGRCEGCAQFEGTVAVLDDDVEDCCCLHLFDDLPWADAPTPAASGPKEDDRG